MRSVARIDQVYIACEEMDFLWGSQEVAEVRHMWKAGFNLPDIAESIERDADEVAILIISLVRENRLGKREGGVWGRKLST